jgi:hypothetical protein
VAAPAAAAPDEWKIVQSSVMAISDVAAFAAKTQLREYCREQLASEVDVDVLQAFSRMRRPSYDRSAGQHVVGKGSVVALEEERFAKVQHIVRARVRPIAGTEWRDRDLVFVHTYGSEPIHRGAVCANDVMLVGEPERPAAAKEGWRLAESVCEPVDTFSMSNFDGVSSLSRADQREGNLASLTTTADVEGDPVIRCWSTGCGYANVNMKIPGLDK